MDGVKPGLAATMIKEGAHITHMKGKFPVPGGQGFKETITPCLPGLMCMIPWKTAQATLRDSIEDQGSLHWRHTFVDYTVGEASETLLLVFCIQFIRRVA